MGVFFYITIGYAIGFLIGYVSYDFLSKLFILMLFMLFMFLCKRKGWLSGTKFLLTVIFFICGFIVCRYSEASYDRSYYGMDNKKVRYTGNILSEPDIREYGVYYIFQPAGEKKFIRLFVKDKRYFFNYGDVVDTIFVLKNPRARSNPGGFDYKEYLKTLNVAATGNVEYIKKVAFEPKSVLKLWSLDIKNKIKSLINKYIPENKSGLIEGMLTGDKDNIGGETLQSFRESGIAHLLTVSGGHAIFFLMPFTFLMKKLKINRKATYIIEILLLTFFCYITGLGVSVCRAAIMMIIYRIACLSGKNYDGVNSLFIAAFILMSSNPYNLLSAGFQLSFAASLSLLILPKHMDKFIKRIPVIGRLPGYICKSMTMALSAQTGVLPLVANLFKKISLIGTLSNIIIVPLVPLMYISCFAVIITDIIGFKILGVIFTYCMYMISYVIEFLAGALGNMIISEIDYSFSFISVIAYYILIFLLLTYNSLPGHDSSNFIKKKLIRNIAIIIVAVLSIVPFNSIYHGMEITFIDVGQGDSTLVRMDRKTTFLIDAGMSAVEIESVLRYKNIRKIDIMFLTHAHDDHMGGAIQLIKNFIIGKIIIPDLEDCEGFDEIIKLSERKNIQLIKMSAGDEIIFHGYAKVRILGPFEGKRNHFSLNNNSLVIKLEYKKVGALFAGDVEEAAEKALTEKYSADSSLLESHILKVPHHGSDTSMTDSFLKCVKPRISIISVGADNKFGHPSGKTVDKLSKKNKVYRTDLHGAVTVKTDGMNKIKIKTFLTI